MEVQAPPSQQQQAEASAGGPEVWDEARLEEAMRRLKLLNIKVRTLRTAIPKMLETLSKPHPTPDALYAAFSKAIIDSKAAVQEFANLMNEVKSQEALARARESRDADPNGIRPWLHTEHPDWFNLDSDQTY